jgi:hypothetical protein
MSSLSSAALICCTTCKYRYIIAHVNIRDAPDIRPIQKPDTGYPVKAGYRKSGRIFNSTYIYRVSSKILNIKDIDVSKDFSPVLTKLPYSIFYIKAVTVSRHSFGNFMN